MKTERLSETAPLRPAPCRWHDACRSLTVLIVASQLAGCATRFKETYYVGVSQKESGQPLQFYRFEMTGHADFGSKTKFSSGWYPAQALQATVGEHRPPMDLDSPPIEIPLQSDSLPAGGNAYFERLGTRLGPGRKVQFVATDSRIEATTGSMGLSFDSLVGCPAATLEQVTLRFERLPDIQSNGASLSQVAVSVVANAPIIIRGDACLLGLFISPRQSLASGLRFHGGKYEISGLSEVSAREALATADLKPLANPNQSGSAFDGREGPGRTLRGALEKSKSLHAATGPGHGWSVDASTDANSPSTVFLTPRFSDATAHLEKQITAAPQIVSEAAMLRVSSPGQLNIEKGGRITVAGSTILTATQNGEVTVVFALGAAMNLKTITIADLKKLPTGTTPLLSAQDANRLATELTKPGIVAHVIVSKKSAGSLGAVKVDGLTASIPAIVATGKLTLTLQPASDDQFEVAVSRPVTSRAVTNPYGLEYWVVGPEGARRVTDDQRLVIFMASNPEPVTSAIQSFAQSEEVQRVITHVIQKSQKRSESKKGKGMRGLLKTALVAAKGGIDQFDDAGLTKFWDTNFKPQLEKFLAAAATGGIGGLP